MKTILLTCLLSIGFYAQANSQTRLYQGTWIRLSTGYLFEFDLHLEHGTGNMVQGYFNWKFLKCDENDAFAVSYYKDKIGMTAKEYIRGTWDANSHTYYLKGYKKDDPNEIISLDEYQLKVDENGDLGGETKSQGTWLGRINAKALPLLNI